MGLYKKESIEAAERAYKNGETLEIFGTKFRIAVFTQRNIGIDVAGNPIGTYAEVELVPARG